MKAAVNLPLSGITSLSNYQIKRAAHFENLPLSGITSLSNVLHISRQRCRNLPLSGITSLSNLKPEWIFGPRRAVRPSPALSFLTGRACQKIWQRSRSTVNRSSASIIRWQDGSSRKKWKCFRNAVRYSPRRASSARQLRKPQKTKHAVPRRSVQRVI